MAYTRQYTSFYKIFRRSACVSVCRFMLFGAQWGTYAINVVDFFFISIRSFVCLFQIYLYSIHDGMTSYGSCSACRSMLASWLATVHVGSKHWILFHSSSRERGISSSLMMMMTDDKRHSVQWNFYYVHNWMKTLCACSMIVSVFVLSFFFCICLESLCVLILAKRESRRSKSGRNRSNSYLAKVEGLAPVPFMGSL